MTSWTDLEIEAKLIEAAKAVMEATDEQYDSLVKSVMKQMGISDLADASDEQKKQLFNTVDQKWNSEKESGTDGTVNEMACDKCDQEPCACDKQVDEQMPDRGSEGEMEVAIDEVHPSVAAMAKADNRKTFRVVMSKTVDGEQKERKFVVNAKDQAQARERAKAHVKDPSWSVKKVMVSESKMFTPKEIARIKAKARKIGLSEDKPSK